MKILFVSLPSIHAVRWIENLSETSHELYWFDVYQRGSLNTDIEIKQFTNWGKRKLNPIRGEYFLQKRLPSLYEKLQPYLEVTANEKLQEIIEEIKPDIIHSFNLQTSAYPILKTLKKYKQIQWIYSCWGSDLYYYKNIAKELQKIKKVLLRVDFLHADCARDYEIAIQLGYRGEILPVIPGGGGYNLEYYIPFKKHLKERNVILVKGYEHLFGRALNVVKALEKIVGDLKDFEVVVFGAHPSVISYINTNQLPFTYYSRHELPQEEVLILMGKSIIYVGNSISDGIPNTLLEAMAMGAFPIQSNPGSATEELITQGKNGFLIEQPEDIDAISKDIIKALEDADLREKAHIANKQIALDYLDYHKNQQKIIALYQNIKDA